MQDLSVSYIFGQAWELTKKNFLNLVLGFFGAPAKTCV